MTSYDRAALELIQSQNPRRVASHDGSVVGPLWFCGLDSRDHRTRMADRGSRSAYRPLPALAVRGPCGKADLAVLLSNGRGYVLILPELLGRSHEDRPIDFVSVHAPQQLRQTDRLLKPGVRIAPELPDMHFAVDDHRS